MTWPDQRCVTLPSSGSRSRAHRASAAKRVSPSSAVPDFLAADDDEVLALRVRLQTNMVVGVDRQQEPRSTTARR